MFPEVVILLLLILFELADEYKNNPYPLWWDQGVLINMFNTNVLDVQTKSVLIDYGSLQHFNEPELAKLLNKPYVRHLAGKSNDIRFETSKKYLMSLNLVLFEASKNILIKNSCPTLEA